MERKSALTNVHELTEERSRLSADPVTGNWKDNKKRKRLTLRIKKAQNKIHKSTDYQGDPVPGP